MKKITFWKSFFLLCALIVGSTNVWGQTYKKITAEPTNWAGEYLIVYESNSSTGYVWTGIDANSNFKTTTISSGTTRKPNDAVSVTIASMTGGYSIKVNGGNNNGKYISGTKDSNTTNFNSSAVANTLTYSSGVDIASNTSHFVFNSTSGTTRYRYYKSATYSGSSYKRPQLYKLAYTISYDANGGTGTMTDSNSPYFAGSTVTTKSNTFEKGGYEFTGWNTKSDGSGTSYAEGEEFTPNENTTLYAQWAVAGTVAAPTFSVAEGSYNATQSVELSCSTPNSTIYYTTDGNDPTTSSSVYSAAIAVNVTTTIKAFATADGMDNSAIASSTYTLKCATPTITIPEGAFVNTKTVTMTSTDGASIYYTTDGTAPTSASTLYDSSNKPSINATTTIKAIAIKDGWTNSEVAEETFTKEMVLDGIAALNAETTSSTLVTNYVRLTDAQITYVESSNAGYAFLNDATAGIYLYTTNTFILNKKYNGIYRVSSKTYRSLPEITVFEEVEGTSEDASAMSPTVMTASDLDENFADNISRQIRINNHTLTSDGKITDDITINTSYHSALTANTTYTLIGYPTWYNSGKQFRVVEAYIKPEAPTFDFADGNEFNTSFAVHLDCETEDVAYYYTLDGETPTTSSSLYNTETGIVIPTATTTVKAVAVKEDMISDVASATYIYKVVAKPHFTPATGSEVFYGETVTIATATAGEVSIYYTTDGTDPTTESTKYTAPVAITADNTTLKAIAVKGEDVSSIGDATYTIKNPEAPTFTLEEGAVPRNTVVTINSREGTTIYYTTDGTDPNNAEDSGVNSVNVTIDESKTLRAVAIDGLANISPEASAAYTIAQVAKPVFSETAGVVTLGTQVTISSTTEGATIYYTLDGTTPTSSSNIYNGYVVISRDENLKAIAIKENYLDSEVASAAYTVAGASESVVFKDLYGETDTDLDEINGTDIKLSFTSGNNDPKYYKSDHTARFYAGGGSLTISSTTKTITRIEYSSSSNYSLDNSSSGTLSSGVWTGKTTSIKINASGTVKFSSIKVFFEAIGESATIGTSKLAGFCSEYAHNFSSTGLTAYKAKVNEGQVVLSPVTDGIVPAYTGIVLNGDADDYEIPFATTDATTDFSDNEMVGVTQRTQVLWNPSDGVYNYILQQGQFNKATTGYLKPNRAYLSTSYAVPNNAKALTIVFEDAATGINGVEEIAPVTKTHKVVKNGRLVIETANGEFTIDGARVK